MGPEQMTSLVAGFVLGAVVALGALGWWVRGRLHSFKQHQHRFEQSRQLADQHMAQARKQIEHLQHECHELRMEVMRHGGKPVQQREVPPPPAVDPAEAARRYVESKLRPAAPADEPEAFPATVILKRSSPAD